MTVTTSCLNPLNNNCCNNTTHSVHDNDVGGCGDDDEYDDYDDCNDDDVDDLDDNYMNEYNERNRVKYAPRMTRMASLFINQSRFEESNKKRHYNFY